MWCVYMAHMKCDMHDLRKMAYMCGINELLSKLFTSRFMGMERNCFDTVIKYDNRNWYFSISFKLLFL